MDFAAIRDALKRNGYSDDTADARIAHDIVLKAVADCGFHDNITVKGGVVMSGRTGLARRATMDMDVDFLRYPLTNEAVRRFVARLNRSAPCAIRMRGAIETLHQQEYKGKRIHLVLSDDNHDEMETKMDIGVHAREDVGQEDFSFDLAFDNGQAMLLVNSNEQIFAEKLKSLLRFGSASTRYKDVFDKPGADGVNDWSAVPDVSGYADAGSLGEFTHVISEEDFATNKFFRLELTNW